MSVRFYIYIYSVLNELIVVDIFLESWVLIDISYCVYLIILSKLSRISIVKEICEWLYINIYYIKWNDIRNGMSFVVRMDEMKENEGGPGLE